MVKKQHRRRLERILQKLKKIKKGMQESGLAIREFLQTDKGEKLFAVRMMKNFV